MPRRLLFLIRDRMKSIFTPQSARGRLLLRHGATILVCSGLLVGCGRDEIKVYRVPKETAAVEPAAHEHAHAEARVAQPRLTWALPAGWEEQKPGEMRVGSFNVKNQSGKQADVSIIPLPGAAGGDLANVNRWRSQVGLKAVTEEELPKLASSAIVGGERGQLYEFAGESPSAGEKMRVIVAVQQRAGTAWFYKMSGDDEVVAQQKPAFIEFLKSIKFSDGATEPSTTAASEAPASGEWKIPSQWKQVAAGEMQQAKFVVGDGGAKAEVTIAIFPTQQGDLLANVNRWRRQIQLEPLADPADVAKLTQTLDLSSGKATLVEMTNNGKGLTTAIVNRDGGTWYVKLLGDESIVRRERDAFVKFLDNPR